ncbi:MAG: Sensor histidine kinase RcsC [Syntrophus sp. SKADARSKE-3]|nr:Sensor histidine kinase RcsC [Syntrophus sp. SKADARSKE-3]
MIDPPKTNKELLEENAILKLRIRELEKSESERKQAEMALQERERHMKLALEGTDQGLWEWDILSRKVVYDENWQRIMNLPSEGRYVDMDHWLASMDAEGRAGFESKMTDYLAGRERYYELEHRLQTKNKDWRWIWTRGIATERDPSGIPLRMIGTYRDITKRKHAEEKLQEREQKYRTLIETTDTGFVIIDRNGFVLDANPEYIRLTGNHELSDIMGRSVIEWTAEYEKEKNKLAVEECLQKGHIRNLEIDYVDAKGNITPIEINATFIETEGMIQIITLCRDITKRRQVEQEKRNLEERLNRAEKMEALGTLAGGVAHDLNNVLGVVIGYSELLLLSVDQASPIRSHLMNIMKGGTRAAAIVQDLLTMARRGVPNRKILNLNKMITDCLRSPEFASLSSLHPDMKIDLDLDPEILNISGSSIHIGKSFYNLVANAGEAMPQGGVLTIKTANYYLDKPIQGYDEVREGDYVVLSVSDTGGGIAAADLKRIFEPFYTKKVMGRSGTGLGLAVVWGTIKDHGGYINVQSEEGRGSTFTIYYPVSREIISAEDVVVNVSNYIGKGETILVVDDVKEQRDLATEMLLRLNYNVVSVSSGEEAVVFMKEHHVDLMVLDMIMDPGMDGLDTYRNILEIHPRQRAIIVSGFSETYRVNAAQALGAGTYVKKPYIIEKLGLAVRKEIDLSE